MFRQFRPAVVSVVVFTLLTGLLFPAVVTGLARLAFPYQAEGSLIVRGGRVTGSELIGQAFTAPRYFHPRPSSAGKGYDATASGGSNLGPLNPQLRVDIRRRVAAYRMENGLKPGVPIPPDAVTSSASGLDPHISPANALLQVNRVARARGLLPTEVSRCVMAHTEQRSFGIFGESRVNVLKLNLALDALQDRRGTVE